VGVMAAGGRLLQYPPALSGQLIFLVEAAIAVSTGLILAALFIGGWPAASPGADARDDARRAP
jgi:hypothetical protein